MRKATLSRGAVPVEFVAVADGFRGSGVGRDLLVAAQVLAGQRTLWLDTSKPGNVSVFGAMGFAVTGRFDDGGVVFTGMQREVSS